MTPSEVAGVVVQANWNNISCDDWGNQPPAPGADVLLSDLLLDEAGNLTGVQLQFRANDAWNSDGATGTPNEKMMKGIVKEGGVGSSMILNFTNLAPVSYEVYVYGNVNDGPVDLDVSIGATTNYWTEPAAFDEASGFMEASSSDPAFRAAGNYVHFAGVTPTSGGITIIATYQGGSDGLGIAGLQLVTSGSFPTNTMPVSIQRQPEPTLGATGGTATFLVWATGPSARYQWFQNSTAIAGATSSSYTTPTLRRLDDGTKYKVTVHNNVNSVTSTEVVLTVLDDPGTRVASLGASFLGNADGGIEAWRLASGDSAGVVVQANWNNLPTTPSGNVGVSDPFLDNANHETAVQLHFAANDAWNSDGPADTPNDKLMKGILKQAEVGSTMILTFTNLVSAFYDVYVYGNVNGGPADLDVSIGPATNYWTEPAAFDDVSGFIQASSSNPNNRAQGNYVKFASVTPASGTITIAATYQGGSDGLGIAGVQIAASAAFPTNSAPVVITSQPLGTVAAPGSVATFLVWANGPFASYQWLKNGTPLSGATSSSYTTPPVTLGDNGSKYTVTVHNNVNSVTSAEAVLTVTNDPGTRVASIGASFLGDGGDVESWRLAPGDSAGVVVQNNWNNIGTTATRNVGLSDPLVDSTGNSTAVQLQFTANDAWNSDGPADTPNDKLMKGLIKENGIGSSLTLTFTKLPPAFYDVYVYGNVNDVNGVPVSLDVSVGAVTNYWIEPAAFDDFTGFIEASSSDPYNRALGNYVKFTAATPASGTITITATYQDGSDGLGIAGVQLLSSAAFPSTTPPELSAALESGQIVVSWTSSATFQLQYRTNLVQGSWADEPTPPVVIGDQSTVRMPATDPARFFRLLGP